MVSQAYISNILFALLKITMVVFLFYCLHVRFPNSCLNKCKLIKWSIHSEQKFFFNVIKKGYVMKIFQAVTIER